MKYYTAFIFACTTKENPLHCTHKYMGTLTEEQLEWVRQTVDAAMAEEPVLPRIEFVDQAMFGPNNDIPVLLPENVEAVRAVLLPELREALSEGLEISDDFGEYMPHVTRGKSPDGRPAGNEPITGYAIMSGSQIIYQWPITTKAVGEE